MTSRSLAGGSSDVVVVGRAEPGYRLQHDATIARQLSIRRLRGFQRDSELQKHLHDVFVRIGVRYTGKNWRSDKKAAAGTKNFRTLIKAGGPKRFFKRVANFRTEDERMAALQGSLKYYGSKGSRDTLIELRLADNCMALDVRIFHILERVGVRVGPEDIYKQVEKALIGKVAKPLGISGAQLDRILFGKYREILKKPAGKGSPI